jgi:hypothetical protein
MLGFLRPSLYSACYLDSSGDLKSTFERNFKRLMGQSTAAHAVTFAEGYSFPLAVAKMLSYLELPPWNRRGSSEDAKDSRQVAVAVFLAQRLAEEVCRFGGFIPLDSLINDLAEKASLKPADVKTAVGDMSERFFEQCLTLGLKPSRLPLYLENYRSKMVGADGKELPPNFKVPGIAERINPFLYELKACLNTRQQGQEFGFFPQALYCTLQALVRGLNFDRAVFFRYDEGENALVPTIIFGERPSELSLLPRKVNSPQQKYMPDVQSLLQHKAVFVGDPVFGEAWPLAAFPVICQGRVEGVFFADKLARKNALPLDTQEQVAIVALAEGWYDVSPDFH